MTNWKTYKLGEIANVNMGQSPKSDTYNNEKIGLPFFQGNRTFGRRYPSIDTYCSSPIKIAEAKDILFSVRAPVGDINFAPEKVCIGRGLCSIRNKSGNQDFLFYLLNFFKQEIINKESGTVFGSVNKSILENLIVQIPPLPTQRSIAEILSSLDDKIELNNQMNKTLEEMAKAVFKQWFVDFDFPDENENPYKSSGGEMVESELGLIPKGWKVKMLSDLMEIKYGKDHKKLSDGLIPVYGSGGIMRYGDEYLYNKESILIPRKGTLSNLFYINKPFWTVDTMFYSIIKKENSTKYLYYFIKDLNLASMNVGSAVPSMTTKVLNSINMILPSADILKKFNELFNPIFECIEANVEGNKELIKTRDLLLPKLLSGEIDVSEAENIIEESEVLSMAAEPETKYNK